MTNKILKENTVRQAILTELIDVVVCTNEDVRVYCENHNIDIYEFIEQKNYVE